MSALADTPGYTLRAASASEYEALFALHRVSMGEYVVATWGPWDDAVQREFFDKRMADGHLDVILAGDEVAGLYEVQRQEHEVFVVNLELLPAFQGQGLGTRILQATMADAAEHALPVVLHVLHINPARRLYERLGFVEFERTETHHHMRWAPPGAGGGDSQ